MATATTAPAATVGEFRARWTKLVNWSAHDGNASDGYEQLGAGILAMLREAGVAGEYADAAITDDVLDELGRALSRRLVPGDHGVEALLGLGDEREALIKGRWEAATNKPIHFEDGSTSWLPNKHYDRIEHSAMALSALVDDEGTWEEEEDDVQQIIADVWTVMEQSVKDFARRSGDRRRVIRREKYGTGE